VDAEWYLTDLGTGPESFHWKLCPHALPDMQRYPDPEDPEQLSQIRGPTARQRLRDEIKKRYGIV